MSRLYSPLDDDDGRVSQDGDVGVSRADMIRVPELMNGLCDDVFCLHADDEHRQRRVFQAWAQYRIAQRGIMVSHWVGLISVLISQL